ncbi:MAG: hypothetical protein NVSMB66_6740 [Candidatus Doudnabacteria bacterium]
MRTKHSKLTIFTVIVASSLISLHNVHAAPNSDSWEKGVTVMPVSDTEYSTAEFQKSIDNAAITNANFVALVIPLYQDALDSSTVHNGWNTPTDNSLKAGIDYIHSKDMKVMLKFHLYPAKEQWVARIHPTSIAAWFNSYSDQLDHYGAIAKDSGVEQICIGTEIISLSTDPQLRPYWEALIDNLKQTYSGPLTYSANWGPGIYDEKAHLTFWDKLDYIGLSAYFPITGKKNWAYWDKISISRLQKKYNKPIIFTEVGYRSISDSTSTPWDYSIARRSDQNSQARAYQNLFNYWKKNNNFEGLFIWSWNTNNTDTIGTDYTPKDKIAQTVISTEFKNSTPQKVNLGSAELPLTPPYVEEEPWYKKLSESVTRLYTSSTTFFTQDDIIATFFSNRHNALYAEKY